MGEPFAILHGVRFLLACILAAGSGFWSLGAPGEMQLFPLSDASRPELPGSDADSKALNEMLGGSTGPRLRWNSAPQLKVLVSVMEYRNGNSEYVATGEQLTEEEIAKLVEDLTEGLGLMTANTFESFAAVEREVVAPGATAPVSQPNRIVVGRFNGVQKLLGTIGLGGRKSRADGTITSGAIILDSAYDRTSPKRHLLRTHELGHALGYNHVQSRASIMNPSIGSEINTFDRKAVLLAFGATPPVAMR